MNNGVKFNDILNLVYICDLDSTYLSRHLDKRLHPHYFLTHLAHV